MGCFTHMHRDGWWPFAGTFRSRAKVRTAESVAVTAPVGTGVRRLVPVCGSRLVVPSPAILPWRFWGCVNLNHRPALSAPSGRGNNGRVKPHIPFLPWSYNGSYEQTVNLPSSPGSVSDATPAFGGILSRQKLGTEAQPQSPSTGALIQQRPRLSPKNTHVCRLPPRWPQRSIAGTDVTALDLKEISDASGRLPYFS